MKVGSDVCRCGVRLIQACDSQGGFCGIPVCSVCRLPSEFCSCGLPRPVQPPGERSA
ncbi:MAG: hypothetical protein ACREB9_05230 [Thermoplasmata archaeon]